MKADVSHHGAPTQANGNMPPGHQNSNLVREDSHAGAGPGQQAGNGANGEQQEPDANKAGDVQQGANEKT